MCISDIGTTYTFAQTLIQAFTLQVNVAFVVYVIDVERSLNNSDFFKQGTKLNIGITFVTFAKTKKFRYNTYIGEGKIFKLERILYP